MRVWLRRLALIFLGVGAVGQDLPLGLVIDGDGSLTRAGNESTIALRRGDLAYQGDQIQAGTSPVTIWFCPQLQSYVLEPGTRVQLARSSIQTKAGRSRPAGAVQGCYLPPVPRVEPAGPAFQGIRLRRETTQPSQLPLAQRLATLRPEDRARTESELAEVDRQLQNAAGQPELRAARGAILHRAGLHAEAAAEFRVVSGSWSTIDWPRLLVHEEEDLDRRARSQTAQEAGSEGTTYALVVGINEYRHLSNTLQLRFASRDAEDFAQFLQTERGGKVPRANITLRVNQDATVPSIRTSIESLLKVRAGKQDTVIVFIAAHGVADSRGAFVLGHESNPENLAATGLPMQELQDLLDTELKNVGRVLLYVDVCRAGTIGTIRENQLSRVVYALARLQGAETFAFLATSPGESSKESERFGGGHGAFSYFLLDALNGAADQNRNGVIDVGEVTYYVQGKVRESTGGQQNPRAAGDMPSTTILIHNTTGSGIALSGWKEDQMAQVRQQQQAPTPAPSSPVGAELAAFDQAIRGQRLLPTDSANAFDALELVRRRFGSRRLETLDYENRLWVALLDGGQEVILQYLRGDEVPQRAADFERGERLFRAALQLDPLAVAVEGRALFCQARADIFAHRYDEAIALLERALRLDAEGSYLYNALGIAYLERGQTARAAAAFRDAIRFSPAWIYPRHNLAIALGELGDNNGAIAAYAAAKRLAPSYWYLPYNLGLLYQRRNQRRQAETELRLAMRAAPDRPEPYNALGLLKSAQGKIQEAANLYLQALIRQSGYAPAHHNLALLDLQRRDPAQAVSRWRQLLDQEPAFLPARFGLAETLESLGRTDEARAEYAEIIRREPDAAGARAAWQRLQRRPR